MAQRTTRSGPVLLLILLLAGSALPAQSAPEVSPEQATAIRQGVQATLDAYREHAAAGRWDALMQLYSDDPRFRWVESGTVVARSAEEIHRHLAALPKSTRIETRFQDTEIIPAASGVAEVVTRFETRVSDAMGGGYSFGGVMTMTLVQRAGGWKILSGHASSTMDRRRAKNGG
jgi:ketosteroid isomerase-like protein